MKKLIYTALILSLCFISAHAQVSSTGWGIKKIGILVGQDSDQIRGLGHAQLLSQADGTLPFDPAALDFEEQDLTSMVCENPNIKFELTLNTPLPNTELRLAAVGIFNRIESVNYRTPYTMITGQGNNRSLFINARGNEIALDGALMKYLQLGNSVRLYGGAGLQVGRGFGTEMYYSARNINPIMNPETDEVIDYERESFYGYVDAHEGTHLRGYLQGGVGVTILRRVELTVDYRGGLGHRWVGQADLSKGTTNQSISVGTKWVLR